MKKYKEMYSDQKYNASRTRGIQFLLTFAEWLKIWIDSGHLENRGNKKGQYVMARFGDIGPYAVDNVRIILCSDNVKETYQNPGGEILRAKRKINGIGNQNKKGKKESAEACEKKRLWHLGKKPTSETRVKLTASNNRKWAKGGVLRLRAEAGGNKKSLETRAKQGESMRKSWAIRKQSKINAKD